MNYDISQNQILEIRKSVDIVDVISSYIPLVPKGRNFFGVCPFHADHSPSMSVSPDKQIYKCFSCGASGNVFNFIMDYENISFIEALNKMADKAGIDIHINKSYKKQNPNDNLYQMYEISQKLYQNNINTEIGKNAKQYLKKRFINNDIIKEFGIGLAFKDNKVLTNLLLNRKYNTNDILNSGLVIETDNGMRDIYYNRIMFPLCDLTGKIVGYSGRIYDTNEGAKYVNTKETKIFKKGELLYNYHRAKDEARIKNQIIVVEGFMDVIGLYKIGIKNVVATMGTAVTKEQALLIKRLGKEIILCFDGDEAGAHATDSCINELDAIGVVPKIVRLEDNMDPDEYVLKYGDKIKIKINNPISTIDFKLQYLKKDKNLQDNIECTNYINQALKEVSNLKDPILIELILQKLQADTNINIEVLKSKLNEMLDNKIEVVNHLPKKELKKNNKYQLAEQYLMYYMLLNKEVVTIFQNHQVYLPTSKYRLLARELVAIHNETSYGVELADIITLLEDNKEYTQTIQQLLQLDLKDEYTKEEIMDYINTISIYNIKVEKSRIKDLMKMEIEPIKKAEYANRIKELKIKEQEIMKEGI